MTVADTAALTPEEQAEIKRQADIAKSASKISEMRRSQEHLKKEIAKEVANLISLDQKLEDFTTDDKQLEFELHLEDGRTITASKTERPNWDSDKLKQQHLKNVSVPDWLKLSVDKSKFLKVKSEDDFYKEADLFGNRKVQAPKIEIVSPKS